MNAFVCFNCSRGWHERCSDGCRINCTCTAPEHLEGAAMNGEAAEAC